jgi:DNA (cytosine-5)-methyltransferase 1
VGKATIITTQPRILDLFAGAGGFSLGFHLAGFKTIAAIDHDLHAVETLTANFSHNGILALQRDLSKYLPENLEGDLKENGVDPNFDVIIGGPPCQGWSSVGRGKLRSLRLLDGNGSHLKDPRNKLYKRFISFVSAFKPKVAIMENVPGMLSHDGRNVAEGVAESIESIGYEVSWKRLISSHYGVPQERQRLIFVGVRKDQNVRFEFPDWKDEKGKRVYPLVTVREAIGDLPTIRNGANLWIRPYGKPGKTTRYSRLMREKMSTQTVFDHVCRNQNADDVEAFGLLRQGGIYRDLPKRLKRYRDDIFDDKYKKLYWDKPSWTVTAHLGKDCYTHIHPSQARTISIREAARLQSFPDSFYFAGNMGTKFRLIGNAVPPLMAKFIAAAVKEQVLNRVVLKARKVG